MEAMHFGRVLILQYTTRMEMEYKMHSAILMNKFHFMKIHHLYFFNKVPHVYFYSRLPRDKNRFKLDYFD